MEVTQELLHEFFDYREDGNLYWKARYNNRIIVGNIAGVITKYPSGCVYRRTQIYGKKYLNHRLIWLYHYGVWPKDLIDHKDRDGLNNKIDNLREADSYQNNHNVKVRKDNSLGIKGVVWRPKQKKYTARIKDMGTRIHLGYFDDPHEASKAYEDYARKLHKEYYRETLKEQNNGS